MTRRLTVALALLAAPAAAETYDCRAGETPFRLEIAGDACRLNHDAGLLSRRNGTLECRVSTPQLRVATLAPDGGFEWEDTDSDRILRGACRRAN